MDDDLSHVAVGCRRCKMSLSSTASVKLQHSLRWNLRDDLPANHQAGTCGRERTYYILVMWTLALCLTGGALEESKSLPAATLRGKQTPCGALVPVKNIPKRGRVQDRKVGISLCCRVHGLCKSHSIRLWAAWINKSCSDYRHLQSILCKKLGSKHRNRSSRAKDLLWGWRGRGNESKLTLCRTEYCPTPSTTTVILKVSLPLAVDYREETDKRSQVTGHRVFWDEYSGKAGKTAADAMCSGSNPISVFMDPSGSNKKLLRE